MEKPCKSSALETLSIPDLVALSESTDLAASALRRAADAAAREAFRLNEDAKKADAFHMSLLVRLETARSLAEIKGEPTTTEGR